METGSKVLDALLITLPLMKQFLKLDMQISLCDTEKTIGVWHGDSIFLDIPVGTYFNPKSPADSQMLNVLRTGEEIVSILPKQIYGVPVRGVLSPVYDSGKIVGVISCAVSMKKQTELEESILKLNESISETKDSFHEIAKTAESLAQKTESIYEYTGEIAKLTEITSEIVKDIETNAKRSNMLALNASIESARAGEAGRGFSVIASQMGDMSKASGNSAKVIGSKLGEMFSSLDSITERLSEITEMTGEQANGVINIDNTVKKISDEAEILVTAAKVS